MSHPLRGVVARPTLACLRAARALAATAAIAAVSTLAGCGGGSDPDASRMQTQAHAQAQGGLAPPLASPAWFVSTTGSDAGDGSPAHPWRTLGYAVSKLQAGNTLYAYGGTYAETVTVWHSGTASQPITIAAYPGQHPVIDAATISVPSWWGLLQVNGSYVTVSGFELRNINVDGHGGLGGTAVVQGGFGVALYGTNDTIASMTIHNTWAQGVMAQGDASTIADSVVHDVATSNCRAAGQPNCAPAGNGNGWASCVSIASPYGKNQVVHGGVIERNTVYNCWGEGVSTWQSDGVTIQDNTIYDNWAENLYVNNATHALVQRNLVYNTPNNLVGKKAGFALADEDTQNVSDLLSAHNVVIDNLIYNASFSAFGWTLVTGTGLVDDVIANNTIVDTDPTTTAFYTGGPGNNVVNTGTTIANNIVIGAANVPTATGLAFSNDLWTARPANGAGAGDVLAANAAAVIAQTGPIAPGALTPAYFYLTPTSPAHVRGVPVPQVTTNYAGAPVQSPPDIGAF